jgi:putative ABC transport system permease protein
MARRIRRITWSELGEGVRIALDAMKTNKLRTVLTTLGIFIGVIVVTVIISVIQGLNTYVSGEISGLGADVVYVSRMPWIIRTYEEYLKYLKNRKITEPQYHALEKQVTLAEAMAPSIRTRRKLKFGSETIDEAQVLGTNAAYTVVENVVPQKGRFITDIEVDNNRNVCVVGSEVADKLFKDQDPTGQRLKAGSFSFLIVGVLEKRGQMFGESMDNCVLIPYTVFMKNFGFRRSIEIQIKARDPRLVDDMIDQVTGAMRRIRGVKAGHENDFAINQASQLMDFFRSMTRNLFIVMIGIGSIALLVGGIGIMNIMLVSVTERTHEIGVRKALGAKKRIILWQFLVESIFISGLGVGLGLLVSVLIAFLIKSSSPIPVNISTWVLFLGIGFTLTIGLFFGLYPASKASKLDPIEALRFE